MVAAVISDLEHAVGDGGALNPVVPARRRLWGGLHEGCTVVSRGPWMLQRGLTAMVMTAPARIVMGQVDRRIDDDDDASFGQHHRRWSRSSSARSRRRRCFCRCGRFVAARVEGGPLSQM